MLPQPLLATALEYILAKMTAIHNFQIGAWQRQFLAELFQVLLRMRGKVNFTNMARYSAFSEQTFRRHFQKAFRWVALNLMILRLRHHPGEPLIGVFDCTFVPKSGTESYGLGWFFSSAAGRSERGQEVSILGVVATRSREAFGVDATQTPAGLSGGPFSGEDPSEEYSSVDFYVEQIQDLHGQLTEMDRDLITRLRSDANLRKARAIYTGPRKKGPGAPKLYDGKINFDCTEQIERRFEKVGRLPDRTHVEIWTTVANRPWPTARTSSGTCASFCSGTNERNPLCSYARLTRSRRPKRS